jgi:hypothetical protein
MGSLWSDRVLTAGYLPPQGILLALRNACLCIRSRPGGGGSKVLKCDCLPFNTTARTNTLQHPSAMHPVHIWKSLPCKPCWLGHVCPRKYEQRLLCHYTIMLWQYLIRTRLVCSSLGSWVLWKHSLLGHSRAIHLTNNFLLRRMVPRALVRMEEPSAVVHAPLAWPWSRRRAEAVRARCTAQRKLPTITV